jgi:hypothetical protein
MKPVTWDDKMPTGPCQGAGPHSGGVPRCRLPRLPGEDPAGICIDAYTDAEDSFCVLDLVLDRLVDLHVNEGLSMHGIPLPRERAAMTQA